MSVIERGWGFSSEANLVWFMSLAEKGRGWTRCIGNQGHSLPIPVYPYQGVWLQQSYDSLIHTRLIFKAPSTCRYNLDPVPDQVISVPCLWP